MMDRHDQVSSLVLQGFRALIENGLNMDFWLDTWTGEGSLKESFLCNFALAVDKFGPIANFGYWDGGSWHWNVALKKNPFDWKIQFWKDLKSTLLEVFIDENAPNKAIWAHSSSIKYTLKSFRESLKGPEYVILIWKVIWCVLALLKVMTIFWLLLHGRLPDKEYLVRFHLIGT